MTFDLIPAARREVAHAALTQTFGDQVNHIAPVVGGASGALTYRVEAKGRAHLLRIETARDGMRNPHRTFACMRTAAEAGIAPALQFADPDTGVAIMNFIVQRPVSEYPGGPVALVSALGDMTRRLQKTEVFPAFFPYADIIAGGLGMAQRSGMFAHGLLDPYLADFARLRAAYPWEATTVSSHNDPNPRNLLFDGQKLWLVDWETAFRSDPMADLAVLADNFAPTPELIDTLLAAWRGSAPDEDLRTRLSLMRPITRLYYAGLIFSSLMGSPPKPGDDDLSAPTPAEFGALIAQGKLSPTARDTLYILGKMCLAGFREGLAAPCVASVLK